RGEVSALEAGTLMHYVLENVLKKLSEENTYDEKTAEAYARDACRTYLSENLSGAGDIGGRMSFILAEIENTVVAALLDVCREIGKGLFTPSDFELGFAYDGEFPPIELQGENSTVSFSGKVDRVDTYTKGDEVYFRVVDYKSGGKDFSLDRIVNGLDMQLLLYMFAIEELGEEKFGKTPKSAGAMYVFLLRNFSGTRGTAARPGKRAGVVLRNNDIIDALERGDEKEYLPVSFNRDGSFSKSSSVLSEKEFSKIKNRIKKVLTDIGDKLSLGIIDPNPYSDGMFSACTWCDFKSVCAFDTERGGDCMRSLSELRARDILSEEEEK
ncbi:MAG: PD-(D/E)XK nuclease family protein, partial [Oscillospiraceae bacterium]|nr:PD-(D/E)XK nuclease family protein [Oscillospiraceae bacterium]